MADLATRWDAVAVQGDWQVSGADLAADSGLLTALLISLFTDRRAAADDALPDPREDDRRGWWGDLVLDGDAPDPIGSRLWLLARSPVSAETRRRAELYIREALAWLRTDGVADRLDIETEWQGTPPSRLAIRLAIVKGAASTRFDLLWARSI